MAEVIKKILKFGKRDNILKLYKEGEIFCNTLNYFKSTEKSDAVFDKLEGATSIEQFTTLTLYIGNKEIMFSKDVESSAPKLKRGFLSTFDDSLQGNLFCCTAITDDNDEIIWNDKTNQLRSHNDFLAFGDTVLMIHNPMHFISAMQSKMQSLGFENNINIVEYYDSNYENRDLGLFCKTKEYEYQQELRFFIKNDSANPIKFNIGSLEEYSDIYSMI